FHVESGNYKEAGAILEGFSMPPSDIFRYIYVLKAFLSSVGCLNKWSTEELSAEIKQQLCGPMLELAEMFLGERDAKPTERWPHPLWKPEWRLWLGLW